MSKVYNRTEIDGDLAVGRKVVAGGELEVKGKGRSVIEGSLKVDGFIEAKYIKENEKGLFTSVDELNKIYPNPRPGWFALVLDTAIKGNGFLYVARGGKWELTDETSSPYDFIQDSINVFATKGELASTEEELLKRLQGVSENSNASTDPFRYLGNLSKTKFFETIDALNGDSVASREECAGHFRAAVEHRIVDVYSEQIGWANNVWVQRMVCPMQLFNEVAQKENVYTKTGVDKDGNTVSYKYRTHTYTQEFDTLTGASTRQNTVKTYTRTCNKGVWGDWKDVSNNYINSQNYGKKIAFFGGSFAQNMSLTSTPWSFDYQGRTYSLMQYIAEKLGATSFDDYAVGSQGVIVGDIPIIEQLQTAGAGYDIYVIFGGINDFGNETPLGESNGAANDTTYCGGLKAAFDWIRSNNKSAKIYTVTPFKAYTPDDRYWNPRSNIKKKGHTFYEFIQAQKEVAQIHGVPCFDLWANQQFSGASASEHYYTDLLHPNGKGYQAVADALVEFLAYGLGSGVLDAYAVLPNATDTAKGLMSAEDKKKFVKSITWNNDTVPSNMNDFVVAGVYDIKGEHTRVDDNLPILNTGGGHTFNARLTVLDSSISGDGKDDDKCITQVLSFSNRLGQGEVYIRTGKGSSLDNLTWENWSTLQRNVNVGTVTSLDNLVDNGIYSGVYVGTGRKFTFVMVVINDYLLAGNLGVEKTINQFLYAVEVGGYIRYSSRKKIGHAPWSKEEILNKDEIESMIESSVDNAIKGVIADAPEAFDTLKEIADWIANDETGAVALANATKANAAAITAERTRAIGQEGLLNNAIVGEKDRAEQAEQVINDKLDEEIERSVSADQDLLMSIEKESRRATEAEQAIVKDTDKKIAAEIDKIKDGDTLVGQAREIHSRNGKIVTDSFLARTTAGSGTIGDGVASLKSVGGNIVKTLVDINKMAANGANTTFTIHKNIAKIEAQTQYGGLRYTFKAVVGHKYYVSAVLYNPSADSQVWAQMQNYSGYNRISDGYGLSSYVIEAKNVTETFLIITNSKTVCTFYATAPLLIDLTEMFYAGNEPDKDTCDKLFGTMDALPQGLSIANPTIFKSTGFNQVDPENILKDKGINNNAIDDNEGGNLVIIPCLPCKVGVGENNGYCIHGDFGDNIKVYLTPLNPMEVDGELYMHELTKDATTDTYVPLIKGYMLVEVPTTSNLCAHFLWSEDKCKRDAYEPYFESKVELPDIPQMSEWGLAGIQSSGALVCDEIDFERGVYVKRIGRFDGGSVVWTYDEVYGGFLAETRNLAAIPRNESPYVLNNYPYVGKYNKVFDKTAGFIFNNRPFIKDSSYGTDATAFKAAMQGVMLYYELAEPEEYPLPKIDNNYISSDYGVELFDSVVPCNANNLYYMRSLAGEIRNFLDRLMAGLGTSDATVVADRILAVVNPAVEPANVEPETPIEE